jgi:hypothetical protein
MIIGLVILVEAVVAGVAGVMFNDDRGRALTHSFAVFGYHATGSAGTLFPFTGGDRPKTWLTAVIGGDRSG